MKKRTGFKGSTGVLGSTMVEAIFALGIAAGGMYIVLYTSGSNLVNTAKTKGSLSGLGDTMHIRELMSFLGGRLCGDLVGQQFSLDQSTSITLLRNFDPTHPSDPASANPFLAIGQPINSSRVVSMNLLVPGPNSSLNLNPNINSSSFAVGIVRVSISSPSGTTTANYDVPPFPVQFVKNGTSNPYQITDCPLLPTFLTSDLPVPEPVPTPISAPAYVCKTYTTYPTDYQCPSGFALATSDDAMNCSNLICQVVGTWDILRLQNGGSFDGSGYGCGSRTSDPRQLGGSVCASLVAPPYNCYWMKNVAPYPWIIGGMATASTTKSDCKNFDSCNGGGGASSGGCYKWATGPDALGQPW